MWGRLVACAPVANRRATYHATPHSEHILAVIVLGADPSAGFHFESRKAPRGGDGNRYAQGQRIFQREFNSMRERCVTGRRRFWLHLNTQLRERVAAVDLDAEFGYFIE